MTDLHQDVRKNSQEVASSKAYEGLKIHST